MSKKLYPTDLLKQAQNVLGGWNQILPVPTFGAMTTVLFTTDVTAATALETQITALEAQLTDKRNQRDASYTILWDKVKRVRNSVKGIYGDDSSYYEMVGGTRLSERKSPARKTVVA